jgi:rhodanese-related sulfurtransferase
VTRKESPEGEDIWLAELSEGDSCGEEALVSDAKRNATVTMLTDGKLMRLAKKDFVELMKKPLVNYVDYDEASAMVDKDAVWLDVRTPDEYESSAFEDSVNIPLSSLRGEMPELVFNAKYVICCDTGRRSDSAAFILSHKGFDVYVLEGGYSAMLPDDLGQSGISTPENKTGLETPVADVIESAVAASDPDEQAGQGVVNSNDAESEAVVVALLEEEIKQYQSSEARMVEQLEQLRGELGESGEKLGTLYAQSKSDADDQQLLRDQYSALQEGYESTHKANRMRMISNCCVINTVPCRKAMKANWQMSGRSWRMYVKRQKPVARTSARS